ncbi:cobalamin biosynthesis protein P47K [Photobacterium angustum]|uniref:GTP-binding protein n=1 Tax=Photobacterium angustum TaxID=661 RepID=A0ABX5H0B4_PHOAN|nr:GTP-binding protein [Photobacterium angustum]KJG37402.1 cobalamin biosynthesis protein P47K [Photobacterium angustum]PSX05893.1 GTP-binding protein [Photobacterium angustum]
MSFKVSSPILGVPTNIITGFLGVGKTSAILHLMKSKPDNERWAVLVNEFGEIGVDGSLLQGQSGNEQQIFIKEVPGGCMCCTAGLPMQIALNQLLSEAKPDRLIIEPTGLGHPKEVMQVLSTKYYRDVLSLQKNITLVDARKLSDPRYTSHDTFRQQIAIADTVVGNKTDLYQAEDKEKLKAFVAQVASLKTKVIFAKHGVIPFNEFDGETRIEVLPPSYLHRDRQTSVSEEALSEELIPESGVIKATNQGEGFKSIGWRFASEKVFERQSLHQLFQTLNVERMKAVFITSDGIFGYNKTADGITEVELDECAESRVEIIADTLDDELEGKLLDCLIVNNMSEIT